MSAQTYRSFHDLLLTAAVIVTAVRLRDWKFGVKACQLCGERDQHAVGCPGRR